MPSHYLNQCCLVVNGTIRNKINWNFDQYRIIFIQENKFENVVWKISAILFTSMCHHDIFLQNHFLGLLVNSPHKWPVMQKVFPHHDIIMMFLQNYSLRIMVDSLTEGQWCGKHFHVITSSWYSYRAIPGGYSPNVIILIPGLGGEKANPLTCADMAPHQQGLLPTHKDT